MTESAIFTCSICNEPSTDICAWCTKDACRNHHCHRCHRCSDCCECDVPVADSEDEEAAAPQAEAEPAPVLEQTAEDEQREPHQPDQTNGP